MIVRGFLALLAALGLLPAGADELTARQIVERVHAAWAATPGSPRAPT